MKSDYFAAIMYAAGMHYGQMYSNRPYIVHPMEVAELAALFENSDLARAVAVLHDVVEDTNATIEYIEDAFGPEIAGAVTILTRDKEGETYREYIKRIKDANNNIAISVKKADLCANLRNADWFDNKKSIGLIKRWAWALTELEGREG